MDNKLSEEEAQEIFKILDGQRFYDWYNGEFEAVVQGRDDAPSQEEILEDIKDIFSGLKK